MKPISQRVKPPLIINVPPNALASLKIFYNFHNKDIFARMSPFVLSQSTAKEPQGWFAALCPFCSKTRATQSVSLVNKKQIWGIEYAKEEVCRLAVCGFCDGEAVDPYGAIRELDNLWEPRDGIPALIDQTIEEEEEALFLEDMLAHERYCIDSKIGILESIRQRTKDGLKDKGGLGALLGLVSGAILGWWLSIGTETALFAIAGLAVIGLIGGVAIWRLMLSRHLLRKYTKAALKKHHQLSAESLLSVTLIDTRRYRAVGRSLERTI